MRLAPTRAGLIGGAAYLLLTAAWLVVGQPPGPRLAYELWFIPLIAVGTQLPGPANQVTLARAYLAAPALVYASSPGSLGALAVCVAVASLTDLLDGTVARRWSAPSRLGGGLDPVVDGVFFGAVAVGLALSGLYPWWVAAAVILRYWLPALVGGALLLSDRRPTLYHSVVGQASTVAIAILLGGAALLRGLGQDPAAVVRVAEVAVPALAVATFANLAWDNRAALAGGGSDPAPGG